MPTGLENPGLDGSHPPANTPGGMSDGGPRSNYSDRAHSPSAIARQEEEEEVTEHTCAWVMLIKFASHICSLMYVGG